MEAAPQAATTPKTNNRKIPLLRAIYNSTIGCPVEKALLAYLLWRCNPKEKTLHCYPSIQRIADDNDMSPRTAQRKLKSLEAKGWIKIKTRKTSKRSNQSNVYTLNESKILQALEPKSKKNGNRP